MKPISFDLHFLSNNLILNLFYKGHGLILSFMTPNFVR